MTNSYDVDHGLSQDAPGPLEPVELSQQDDTLVRTGNTARDQEMYAAGIRTGEENTKHNAAIRAGVPDGWRLVPNTMTLDMRVAFAETWFSKVRCIDDPEMEDAYAAMLSAAPTAPDAPLASPSRAIFGDQIGGQMDAMASVPSLSSLHGLAPGACEGMKSEDYVNKVRNGGCSFPDCAAPGVSTVEDEQHTDACPRCGGTGNITVLSDNSPDAHDVEVCCDHCQGTGAAVDAAKYLAAALSGEKYRHMQIYGEFKNFHRSLCARFGYCHDEIHFRRDLVSLEEAIAAKVAAPAAGDAQALLDHPLLRDVLGYIEDAGPADVWGAAQSWMSLRDAALAAQRKGDA